jgi:hypothetical protein
MGMTLDPAASVGDLDVSPGAWDEYLRVLELPVGLLADADPADFHVVVGRCEGEAVAAGMAFRPRR